MGVIVAVTLIITNTALSGLPERINGLYLPPGHFTPRKLTTLVHYYRAAGLNAVVLHAKDPLGRVFWKTDHPTAERIGAVSGDGSLERAVKYLTALSIWTIAKVDLFADDRLARKIPELAVVNRKTGGLWSDKNGLHWANPYDRRVWEYNIALCRELVAMGFDEIQFDYIRFPSDGELSKTGYPSKPDSSTPASTVGEFLSLANKSLGPLGVVISIDLFGLTAWKNDDFGVGQVLELISPHVDVICPMLYPSHFPKGFLGWKDPSAYPEKIMALSMARMGKRTKKRVRPWVQGFWYTPGEINAQIDGIVKSGSRSWMVWNPSADYENTFIALAKRGNTVFLPPKLYPGLPELLRRGSRSVAGEKRVVNFTDYDAGYSILSLEESDETYRSPYGTLVAVVHTLDEAILDRVLLFRNIPLGKTMGKRSKVYLAARALAEELRLNARAIQPFPIYLSWGRGGGFSLTPPYEVEDTSSN